MAWDWVYKAGPAGSVETLGNYCLSIRVLAEFSTGKRGSNPVVEYRHGEYTSARKYVRASNLVLETAVRYTNSAGAVVHGDGAAGHVMENLGHLKRLFGGTQDALCRLQRTAPDQGTTYLDVELLGEANPSQARHIFTWPLHAPPPVLDRGSRHGKHRGDVDGRWRRSDRGCCHQVDWRYGRRRHPHRIGCIGHDLGGDAAGGVYVDVGAGTCVKVTGGADWSNYLVVNKPWWFELDPGANAVTNTGGTTHSLDWFTQWR